MAKRRKHKLTEYEKLLRQFHKQSSRHVLVLEADMLYQDSAWLPIWLTLIERLEMN